MVTLILPLQGAIFTRTRKRKCLHAHERALRRANRAATKRGNQASSQRIEIRARHHCLRRSPPRWPNFSCDLWKAATYCDACFPITVVVYLPPFLRNVHSFSHGLAQRVGSRFAWCEQKKMEAQEACPTSKTQTIPCT